MSEKRNILPMSGFCTFGENSHGYCRREDCTCECHKENE